MPKQIPYFDLLFHTVRYLANRQVDNRPTTVWALSKRMGYGVEHIQGLMELNRVEYVLIPHGDVSNYQTTEILLKSIPETIVVELGIGNDQIKKSFNQAVGQVEQLENIELPDSEEKIRDLVDPEAKYRISRRTYEILKSNLMTVRELNTKLMRKGYPKRFMDLTFIRDKLYEQCSPVWRPYFYGKNTYFLKDCMKAVKEIDIFIPKSSLSVGKIAQYRRSRKRVKPENPSLFS